MFWSHKISVLDLFKNIIMWLLNKFSLEDIDYVTEVVGDVEDTTEVEEVVVVTTPLTTPLVQTTSAEPLIEDDLILTRSESEADTV